MTQKSCWECLSKQCWLQAQLASALVSKRAESVKVGGRLILTIQCLAPGPFTASVRHSNFSEQQKELLGLSEDTLLGAGSACEQNGGSAAGCSRGNTLHTVQASKPVPHMRKKASDHAVGNANEHSFM